uniref:Proline and serine rich 2 n=1 Tax=Neogobius melanostomus TaxID=47308 RepID=A0A8C6TXU2_9GOBI
MDCMHNHGDGSISNENLLYIDMNVLNKFVWVNKSHTCCVQDELKFLSQEEQEILNFFEQTIDSLEQSLEEDELRPQVKCLNNSTHVVDFASNSGPHLQANPKEQDIIDLVCPKPDLVETKGPAFNPTTRGSLFVRLSVVQRYISPSNFNAFVSFLSDFQSLIQQPERHFEIKPRNEPVDSLSNYNPPIPENYPGYHPPGSIPTPVLIAQKIADNQSGGGSSVLSTSSLLRRRSSEFEKSTSSNKQGPPTSTKPVRYPSNISVILGNREQQNQSLANVHLEERKAQMLANLSGTSHPLVQEEHQQDQKERNTPTRSVSFRDPTPEKSRMEALSNRPPTMATTSEFNPYGGKSKVMTPIPLPSPQQALSPEHKRRTGSLFRPQGITVQFSGKGTTEESRKAALRKLGLLKE